MHNSNDTKNISTFTRLSNLIMHSDIAPSILELFNRQYRRTSLIWYFSASGRVISSPILNFVLIIYLSFSLLLQNHFCQNPFSPFSAYKPVIGFVRRDVNPDHSRTHYFNIFISDTPSAKDSLKYWSLSLSFIFQPLLCITFQRTTENLCFEHPVHAPVRCVQRLHYTCFQQ